MVAFSGVEKLRCARKIVKFKTEHPSARVDTSVYDSFIAGEAAKIEANRDVLWPGAKNLDHWSGKKMHERVNYLGSPFDQIYAVEYPRLSWCVHAGLTGVSALRLESFTALCGVALKSSTDSYEQILLAVIEEFRIGKADDKIKQKLMAAKFLPFTSGKAEAEELFRQLVH